MKLQENQTGDASQFLGLYILSYCMYMLVSDLLILFRVGIMEIKDMMQPHGGGRMEEKHDMCDAHVLRSHLRDYTFNRLNHFFSSSSYLI